MAQIQEIDLAIGPNGDVTFEVRGVSGPGCEDLTAQLEAILGGNVLTREYKPSYREQPAQQDQTLVERD